MSLGTWDLEKLEKNPNDGFKDGNHGGNLRESGFGWLANMGYRNPFVPAALLEYREVTS